MISCIGSANKVMTLSSETKRALDDILDEIVVNDRHKNIVDINLDKTNLPDAIKEKMNAVKKFYPQRISEAEPKKVGGTE